MPIRQLGYVHWETPDLAAWEDFATNVLGFMPTKGPDPDALYFRWDERPYRLVLTESSEKKIGALGFEVADDVELAATADVLRANGHDVCVATDDEARQRLATGLLRFKDPAGIPVEIFYGPILNHERIVTPLVSSFVTENMGLGHVVLGCPDVASSQHLYRDVLGFHRRNTMRLMMPGAEHAVDMCFLGCNERHHSVGIVGVPFPGILAHMMVEVATIDDVGMALDRCAERNVPIQASLGRHTNDRMLSFYCGAPDGVGVEVGWGGLHIADASKETTYEITKSSFWGHKQASK
ncbi:MAG TPA: VOC family protein [Ilumatobacteraceae bacterium]|jgi:3,4-dihydroxy-9,10-secoandrosta-1,3,5(10)-triene-9,17-dione 4,5-dioxygenase